MIRNNKFLLLASLALTFLFSSCEDNDDVQSGKVSLALTDAPVDAENVSGVYITITGIEYKKNDNSWESFGEFEGPKKFNLMDLTNGETALLGEFNSGAGEYTGLRFLLDAPERGQSAPSSPGAYLEYNDGAQEALFVPSGGQTGYKAVGNFTVPSNGDVEVTADFDARKSVVEAGQTDRYILKPTIRVIVNNQAGSITGTVSNRTEDLTYKVFAYEAGSYSPEEADDPEAESVRFPNAVSGSNPDDQGNYTLAFLSPGEYELVIGSFNADGTFNKVEGTVEGVQVESLEETTQEVNINDL